MTPVMLEATSQELNSLEQADFIESSNFPFAFPTVYVMKKDKTIQVCINFRKVNYNIVNNAYPLKKMKN